jgi:hypothetical protein
MESSGIRSPRSAAAIDWEDWGIALNVPRIGAILVFPHHVGQYMGHVGDMVKVLGGNQSNTINIGNFRMSEVVAVRWPEGVK